MQLRRVLVDGGREVTLTVRGVDLEEETPRRARVSRHATPLDALVALHRRAHGLGASGMVEELGRAWGAVELPPELGVAPIALPRGRPDVERTLGESLAHAGARALPAAAPLLLLTWPVGYRFAALFESHPGDRGGKQAVARILSALEPADAGAAGELFRVALVQRNRTALGPALRLLPASRSFDAWMDVLELADDVGDERHLPALRALARGRVPSDAREPLRELTREIARRR